LALTPGFRLGVYEVTAPIGEGGMGQVFRARDTTLNRNVALKVLPDSFASDPVRGEFPIVPQRRPNELSLRAFEQTRNTEERRARGKSVAKICAVPGQRESEKPTKPL
jgi:serine/threonine protein kinase